MDTTFEDLQRQCNSIAETLKNPPLVDENGCELDYDKLYDADGEEWDGEETGTFYDHDGTEVEVCQMNAMDYLSDVLDIEYRVQSDRKTFVSAKVLVAFGGPNIWIDTGAKEVIGAWWGTTYRCSYSEDAMDLNATLEELFGC